MNLTFNEKVLILIIRNFDFLRSYGFRIKEMNLVRSPYLIYQSKNIYIRIEWNEWNWLTIVVQKEYLLFHSHCCNVGILAKKYGSLLDTGSVFEQIYKYADFMQKNIDTIINNKTH